MKDLISDFKFRHVKKGKDSKIGRKTVVNKSKNIIIGDSTYINSGMLIAGEKSKIIIGNNCLISYNVHIRTRTHNYKDKNVLINKQGESERDIIIEDDVWIGYGAQIMPGVKIEKGAVIGAGAVVTKNVEKYSVVAGVPAKQIGRRI